MYIIYTYIYIYNIYIWYTFFIWFTILEMWFSLSLPIILVSFEFITISIIGTFCLLLGNWCSYNSVVRNLWKNILKDQVFLHFDKIPNYFRQVLQIYSEICIFCVLQKNVLQKQSGKIDLKLPGKSCDESDDNVMKFIVNLGQKYERKVGH